MFSFLTSASKDSADPLVTAKVTDAWLRRLPALDVLGRQQHVMQAFESMRHSRRSAEFSRVQAIEFLDAALGSDRRQLIKQYVENVDSNPKLAGRLWQAVYDLTQGFVGAYQTVLEDAVAQSANSRWKLAVPLLFTRLLHYFATDARLRVFRFERWIPAKWMEVHRTYLRACELGVERVASTLVDGALNSNHSPWTPEHEYLSVLLVHQLNTGNLSPAGLDWASSQLRAWCRRIKLEAIASSPEGFFVDLVGKAGLARRTGTESGAMLRYLDTTALTDQLDRALMSLRQAENTDQGPATIINQQRVAVLEKVRPAIAPSVQNELRRDPRVACAVAAKVRIGIARICRELAAKDRIDAAAESHQGEQIEVYAVANSPRTKRRPPDQHDTLAATLSSFSDPMWQVKDRSVAGLRIAASGGIGQALVLGALVAVRQSDISDWVLGVVRRLNKLNNDDVEAGVSLVAEHVVPVVLHAKRDPKEDLGFVVDGVDASTMGARFDGLYLPPPSRPDKPLSVKTLIVPTAEYSDGRNVILTTGRSVYTVALRHLVEQRAEWSWCAIQIVEKRPRE